MSSKLLLVLFAGVLVLSDAAPNRNEQDLKRSFVEFLQQDKELSALLNHQPEEVHLQRTVRQVEDVSVENNDAENPQNNPGFFDRAAKFVMEVLQRFLKWINTDN